MSEERIFSGNGSIPFWAAVRRSKDKNLLYDYGCKAQEMETSHDILLAACEKVIKNPQLPDDWERLNDAIVVAKKP